MAWIQIIYFNSRKIKSQWNNAPPRNTNNARISRTTTRTPQIFLPICVPSCSCRHVDIFSVEQIKAFRLVFPEGGTLNFMHFPGTSSWQAWWCFSCTFWCFHWSFGCCTSQSILMRISEYNRLQKKTLKLHYWLQPKSTKAMNVSGSGMVPNHWKHWMNYGISTRRDVCHRWTPL